MLRLFGAPETAPYSLNDFHVCCVLPRYSRVFCIFKRLTIREGGTCRTCVCTYNMKEDTSLYLGSVELQPCCGAFSNLCHAVLFRRSPARRVPFHWLYLRLELRPWIVIFGGKPQSYVSLPWSSFSRQGFLSQVLSLRLHLHVSCRADIANHCSTRISPVPCGTQAMHWKRDPPTNRHTQFVHFFCMHDSRNRCGLATPQARPQSLREHVVG